MRTLIKDSAGATRGWYISCGDRITIYNAKGYNLGYFSLSQNKTFDSSGAYIGNGNQLTFLLKPLDN